MRGPRHTTWLFLFAIIVIIIRHNLHLAFIIFLHSTLYPKKEQSLFRNSYFLWEPLSFSISFRFLFIGSNVFLSDLSLFCLLERNMIYTYPLFLFIGNNKIKEQKGQNLFNFVDILKNPCSYAYLNVSEQGYQCYSKKLQNDEYRIRTGNLFLERETT